MLQKNAGALSQVVLTYPSPPRPRPAPRPGDLGAIDARYDVAASTACPALDYIVVETTSAAQRCVELLRQRQLGVATFLILEKQGHLQAAMAAKAAAPEGGWVGGWMGGRAGGRAEREKGTLGPRQQLCANKGAEAKGAQLGDPQARACLQRRLASGAELQASRAGVTIHPIRVRPRRRAAPV